MSIGFKTNEVEFLKELEKSAQDETLQVYESMPAGQARAVLNHYREIISKNDPKTNELFLEKAKKALELGWATVFNSNR